MRTCFSATVEAYASRDDGTARRGIVSAVCRRRARCGEAVTDEAACVAELDDPKAAWSKVVAVARREEIAKMAACVEERPCAEADPVGSCSSP